MTSDAVFRLFELVEELREEAIPPLAANLLNDARACDLCGVDEYRIVESPSTAKVETYRVECPQRNCDGWFSFQYVTVTVDGPFPLTASDFLRVECSNCKPSLISLEDIIETLSPAVVRKYHPPAPQIQKEFIQEHHISYHPEATIPVCASCHGKIHSNRSFSPELCPERTRAWEVYTDV